MTTASQKAKMQDAILEMNRLRELAYVPNMLQCRDCETTHEISGPLPGRPACSNCGKPLDPVSEREANDMMIDRIEQLNSEVIVLVLRLMGEEESTFSPECKQVMDMWRPRAVDELERAAEQ